MSNLTINCEEESFRERCIRLTAERIHAVSDQLVSAISEKWESRVSGPLFAVIGEKHYRPAHELAFLSTALKLRDKGYLVSVGLEHPYNLPDIGIELTKSLWAEKEPSDERSSALETLDWLKARPLDDPVKMSRVAAALETEYNPNTFHYTTKKLHERNIRYAFNDAARIKQGEEYLLDIDDLHIQRLLAPEQFLTADMKVNAADRRGIFWRNRFMVQRAREHAATRPVDIYIQSCGNAHVAGAIMVDGTNSPYCESLVSLFRQAGCDVHGFTLDNDIDAKIWKLPPDIDMNLVTSVALGGRCFFQDTPEEQEKTYLDAVTRHLDRTSADSKTLRPGPCNVRV